jgi:hypothetical protein
LDAGKIRVVHVIGGFRYDISGPQAGFCKRFHGQNRCFSASEEGYWKDFLLWIFFTKRQLKIVKTISAHSKITVLIFRTFKTIYSSHDTIPLSKGYKVCIYEVGQLPMECSKIE